MAKKINGADIPPGLELAKTKWHEVDRTPLVDGKAKVEPGQVIVGFSPSNMEEFTELERTIGKQLDAAAKRTEDAEIFSASVVGHPLKSQLRPPSGTTANWLAVVFPFKAERLGNFNKAWKGKESPKDGLTLWVMADRKQGMKVIGSLVREATYFPGSLGTHGRPVLRAMSGMYLIDQPGGMQEAITGSNAEERGRQVAEFALKHIYGKA